MATEANVKKLGGTVGWGVAGGLVAGPLGLVAGAVLGGNGKEVTFVCTLKDGRSFVATAEPELFAKIKAGATKNWSQHKQRTVSDEIRDVIIYGSICAGIIWFLFFSPIVS